MRLTDRQRDFARWTARIGALVILLCGLPFYFGYGNPLPFAKPEYTLWDNTWLTVFPIMFLGLALGWRFPRLGGWLVVGSVSTGLLLSLISQGEAPGPMFAPLLVGAIYLLTGRRPETD